MDRNVSEGGRSISEVVEDDGRQRKWWECDERQQSAAEDGRSGGSHRNVRESGGRLLYAKMHFWRVEWLSAYQRTKTRYYSKLDSFL